MVDLAHEEAQPFLLLFAFGNILHGADDYSRLAADAGTLEKNKSLHSTSDLGVSPLNPILMCGALGADGWSAGLAVRPKPFGVVWMHQLLQIFDRQNIRRNSEKSLLKRLSPNHLGRAHRISTTRVGLRRRANCKHLCSPLICSRSIEALSGQ